MKSKPRVTRGERGEGRGKWGKIGEGPSRNMFKGHIDKAKGGRIKRGAGGVVRRNEDNCT